jgi:hypothetical protein
MAKIQIENLKSNNQIQQLDRDEQFKIHGGTVFCFKPGEPFNLPGGGVAIPLIPIPCPPSPQPDPVPISAI